MSKIKSFFSRIKKYFVNIFARVMSSKNNGFLGLFLVVAMVASIISAIIGLLLSIPMLLGLWTERNIEFWGAHFSGHAVDIGYWWCVLLSLLAPIVLLLNVICEILKAFV